MTVALPTLAAIDAELARAQAARAAAVLEVGQHRALILEHEREVAGLWCAVADLDESTDQMLELRSRVAALPVVAGA